MTTVSEATHCLLPQPPARAGAARSRYLEPAWWTKLTRVHRLALVLSLLLHGGAGVWLAYVGPFDADWRAGVLVGDEYDRGAQLPARAELVERPAPPAAVVEPAPRVEPQQVVEPPVPEPTTELAPLPLAPPTDLLAAWRDRGVERSVDAGAAEPVQPTPELLAAVTPTARRDLLRPVVARPPDAAATAATATGSRQAQDAAVRVLSAVPGQNPKPDYPVLARRRGIEGTVLVTMTVDASGVVTDCVVTGSSGSGLLDDAALAAARQWRFDHGPGRVEQPFVFSLTSPLKP